MPTAYTQTLMEKEQPFQDFALQCARNFGALISMRDESWDAPIPDSFGPGDYNTKALAKAKKELARLVAMTLPQQKKEGEVLRQMQITKMQEWLGKDTRANARIDAMRSKVWEWQPPSPDHVGLKDFMLDQLMISRENTDYIHEEIRKAEDKTPMGYYADAIDRARRDVEYHTAANAKEIDRRAQQTAWVQKLKQSLA